MGRRGKNIRKRKVSSFNEARKKETNWWLLHGRFLIRMLYVALHLTELSSTPTIDYFMKNRVTLLGTIWNFLVDISWWFFWRGLSMDYIMYIYIYMDCACFQLHQISLPRPTSVANPIIPWKSFFCPTYILASSLIESSSRWSVTLKQWDPSVCSRFVGTTWLVGFGQRLWQQFQTKVSTAESLHVRPAHRYLQTWHRDASSEGRLAWECLPKKSYMIQFCQP